MMCLRMPNGKSHGQQQADQFMVSLGSVVVNGRAATGVALYTETDSWILFLQIEPDRRSSQEAPAWIRLPKSDFNSSKGPLDESLIEEAGISGHRYVFETQPRLR